MTRWTLGWACGWAVAVSGCGPSSTHKPLSPEAAKVRYTESQEPASSCKRLGTARGSGRDPNEKVAQRRAVDATREQAAEMGGNVVVLLENQRGGLAGAGGPEAEVVAVVEVYRCEDAGAAIK